MHFINDNIIMVVSVAINYFCRGLHLAVRVGMISGLAFMLLSIILLTLCQRGVMTFFDDGKAVIPLRAFLDKRPSDDHDNTTIILAQVRKGILTGNQITGCEAGDKPGSSFEIVLLDAYKRYIHRLSPSLTHDEVIILCYDLQLTSRKARPFVTYRNAYNYPVRVEAKTDIITTNGGVKTPHLNNLRVLVCAVQIEGTDWLSEEWIQYHKKLGFDFIHLYTAQLNKSLENSQRDFLHVDLWQGGEINLGSRSLQSMDCLYRYQGLFQHVLVYDTTDYFVPMISNKFNIKDYIEVMFDHVHTGSVLLRRVVYSVNDSCKFKALLHNMGIHANISNVLGDQEFKELGVLTKGLHKISAVREITPQKAASLMPGYTTEMVSPEVGYVVQIKKSLVHSTSSNTMLI